jgi:hypothetical protein
MILFNLEGRVAGIGLPSRLLPGDLLAAVLVAAGGPMLVFAAVIGIFRFGDLRIAERHVPNNQCRRVEQHIDPVVPTCYNVWCESPGR